MAGNWTVVLQEVFLFACWNIHVVQLCQLAAGKGKTNKKLNQHCVAHYAVISAGIPTQAMLVGGLWCHHHCS